jgi:hypothetical protein
MKREVGYDFGDDDVLGSNVVETFMGILRKYKRRRCYSLFNLQDR